MGVYLVYYKNVVLREEKLDDVKKKINCGKAQGKLWINIINNSFFMFKLRLFRPWVGCGD
jgi:hypothetical protein